MSMEQRAKAFETACKLIKDVGSGPYHHFAFALQLAQWLYGAGSDKGETT
jgi:hypothetical protein